MSARYYGRLLGLAASLSLPLAGCGLELKREWPAQAPQASTSAAATLPASAAPTRVASAAERDDTDMTLWTVLGLAKRDAERNQGPQTGTTVSPVLWQAALETLQFAGTDSEDPMTGVVVTKWYSPPGKPNERLRVSVFILSRALRSDSVAVTVERQEGAGGAWRDAPVAQEVVTGIENAVLQRARQIHAERYRNTMYN